MGSIFDKLEFTLEAVNKITEALKEVTYENIDAMTLMEYGDIIKKIASSSNDASVISTFTSLSKETYSYPILRPEYKGTYTLLANNIDLSSKFMYPNHIKNVEYTEVTVE